MASYYFPVHTDWSVFPTPVDSYRIDVLKRCFLLFHKGLNVPTCPVLKLKPLHDGKTFKIV